MLSFTIIVALLGVLGWILARQAGLGPATVAVAVALVAWILLVPGAVWGQALLWIALLSMVLIGIDPIRLRLVTRPFFRLYKRMLPRMSDTEREALEAGTVWWEIGRASCRERVCLGV